MGKHRKQKLKRPSDNLPPGKLQEAWSNYLDAEVGRQGARPRWEVLYDTKMMDVIMFEQIQQLEQKAGTSRSDVYLKAFNNVVNRLPLLQRKPLKYYFGVEVESPMTEAEIAEALGINQSNVARRIERALKNLRVLIRKELAKVVREELNKENEDGDSIDSSSDSAS